MQNWHNIVRMIHCKYWGVTDYNFLNNVFISQETYFVLANSADPDEMPHHVVFHLGIHCLLKYLFMGYAVYKGLRNEMLAIDNFCRLLINFLNGLASDQA